MGGRIRFIVSGSAPLSKEIADFFETALDCNFYERYGSAESTTVICMTKPKDRQRGHVGGVIPCAELKLVDIPEMNF